MTLLPPSPIPRTSLLKGEAAKLFSIGRNCFREKFLDTGILEENFLGGIWADQCTREYVEARIVELGLGHKFHVTTPLVKLKPLTRKVA